MPLVWLLSHGTKLSKCPSQEYVKHLATFAGGCSIVQTRGEPPSSVIELGCLVDGQRLMLEWNFCMSSHCLLVAESSNLFLRISKEVVAWFYQCMELASGTW